jgi:hypothetical protein
MVPCEVQDNPPTNSRVPRLSAGMAAVEDNWKMEI